jgi:hypothetical protein
MVMMMVMMPVPATVMMVVVMMMVVRELDAPLTGPCRFLLIQRLQLCARIRDRLEQFGIGGGGKHVSRPRRGCGLRGPKRSERGHRSQKSGHFLVQSIDSLGFAPATNPPLRSLVPDGTPYREARRRLRPSRHAVAF